MGATGALRRRRQDPHRIPRRKDPRLSNSTSRLPPRVNCTGFKETWRPRDRKLWSIQSLLSQTEMCGIMTRHGRARKEPGSVGKGDSRGRFASGHGLALPTRSIKADGKSSGFRKDYRALFSEDPKTCVIAPARTSPGDSGRNWTPVFGRGRVGSRGCSAMRDGAGRAAFGPVFALLNVGFLFTLKGIRFRSEPRTTSELCRAGETYQYRAIARVSFTHLARFSDSLLLPWPVWPI